MADLSKYIDSLCGRSKVPGPAPWQEFNDTAHWMIGNPCENVTEAGLRNEAVELGGLDQGIDRRRALATQIGACEQPILATERDAA